MTCIDDKLTQMKQILTVVAPRLLAFPRLVSDDLVMRQHFLVLQQARNRVMELATEIEGCMGDTLDGVSMGRIKEETPTDAVFDPTRPPSPSARHRPPRRSQPLPLTARRCRGRSVGDCVTLRACIAPCPASCCARRCCRWRRCGAGPRALLRHALGPDAVRLASPSLARATAGARKDRALERVRAARRLPAHAARPAGGRVHGDARGSDGDRDGRTGRAPRAELGTHRSVRARPARRSRAARAHAAARRSVGAARRRRRPLAGSRHGGGARRSARAERRPDRPARRSVRRSPRGGAGRAAARHPGGGATVDALERRARRRGRARRRRTGRRRRAAC